MAIKDDLLNELNTIPLEAPKPADSTNPEQQQIEKDAWGGILNKQTFFQYDKSVNILKNSVTYVLNNLLGIEYLNSELKRLDDKNIFQDSQIEKKVDNAIYLVKIKDIEDNITLLTNNLNGLSNVYVSKIDYNSKITSLETKDTQLNALIGTKLDITTYNSAIGVINNKLDNKVEVSLYNAKITNIDTKDNQQDTAINALQSSKADVSYVDSKLSTLTSTVNSNTTNISNLQSTKANISDVVLKNDINSTLSNYVTKAYADGSYLTINSANNNYVTNVNFNTSQSNQDNIITLLQNNKASKSEVYGKAESDVRYVLRSEWNGGGGGTGGETGVDHSVYATWDSIYTKAQTYNKSEIDTMFPLALTNYLTKTDAQATYIPKTGGIVTGNMEFKDSLGEYGATKIGYESISTLYLEANSIVCSSLLENIPGVGFTPYVQLDYASSVTIGVPTLKLTFHGDAPRPKYNGNELALKSDVAGANMIFQGTYAVGVYSDHFTRFFEIPTSIVANKTYTVYSVTFEYQSTTDDTLYLTHTAIVVNGTKNGLEDYGWNIPGIGWDLTSTNFIIYFKDATDSTLPMMCSLKSVIGII